MMSTVLDIAFAFDYSAKRLNAFANELYTDVPTTDTMDQRTKLRTLCETRQTRRADALAAFKNAFTVVVYAPETLREDGDEKAGQYNSQQHSSVNQSFAEDRYGFAGSNQFSLVQFIDFQYSKATGPQYNNLEQ